MWVVSRRASDLCPFFCVKSDSAKLLTMHRWLMAQGLRYWMGTDESQCSPVVVASDALDFMQELRKKVNETNHEKNMLSIWTKPLSSSPHTPNKLFRYEV